MRTVTMAELRREVLLEADRSATTRVRRATAVFAFEATGLVTSSTSARSRCSRRYPGGCVALMVEVPDDSRAGTASRYLPVCIR
jgi:hypothetical protein